MDIQSAKDQIKDTVEAYLQRDDAGMYVISPVRQRPIFLLGAPGIGKTAIMEQIAQELGIGLVSYSMTHHTRQSALGLPRIVEREFEGFEYDASQYTMSEIVSAVYDYMKRTELRQGILFLDEINCVSETLYPSMLQFLQFKTFGRHRVPEDWVIVCAGNPPEYNKSVHEFDIVTLDRLREIDVDPEYGVWKKYAHEKGLHPAVTTFLEAKPQCFYKVESKPGGGKSFVTARGWEDLADTIDLYEKMEKKVDSTLFVQFLRDDEIADQFSTYYTLFEKYRSDYQIGRILAGDASNAIVNRAQKAEFDERIALIGLMLDMLGNSCNAALDQEAVVVALRDFLRDAKIKLLDGATVEEAIGKPLAERNAILKRRVAAGVTNQKTIRHENLVIKLLKSFVAECTLQNTLEGEPAFNTIQTVYRKEVEKIQPLVDDANTKMDNAFDFVERCFGNKHEMLIFVAELTTRRATTQFVAHYGNEKYYAHNDNLQVDEARKSLSDRINALEDEFAQDDNDLDMGSAAGLRGTSSPVASAENEQPAKPKVTNTAHADLAAFYADREFEYGFATMSRMVLPTKELEGKKMLDICCRRGKGVYKLSAKVGEQGHIIGVDWVPSYIEEAKAGMDSARRKNHLKANNMEFHVCFPEDLIEAGLGTGTMDVVYVNGVVNLFCDIQKSLNEMARVLRPGGLLICETIFASAQRDEKVVEQARNIGNSVQAARTQEEFYAMLAESGFTDPKIVDEREVEAEQGFKAGREVDIIENDENLTFKAVAINVRKPR